MQATRTVGQTAFRRDHLFPHFLPDDGLEVADHGGIGMRAGGRADDVEGVFDVGDPVAQRLVHGVLEGARAGFDRLDLGPQQLHAEDVGLLPLDVGFTHVDRAGQIEQRADGRGGDAVLAGPGFRDDAALAHPPGQQDLADAIVDLVGAGMVQLVPLEVDLGAAELRGQPLRVIQRAGTADVMRQVVAQFRRERGIDPGGVVRLLDLKDQRHQRLGDETSAIDAEVAALVGTRAVGVELLHDALRHIAGCPVRGRRCHCANSRAFRKGPT